MSTSGQTRAARAIRARGVQFSTRVPLSSAYALRDRRVKHASCKTCGGDPIHIAQRTQLFSTPSPSTVEERLAAAERELKVQFTRIAQLQAQLNRVVVVFRAVPTDPDHSDEQPGSARRGARSVAQHDA